VNPEHTRDVQDEVRRLSADVRVAAMLALLDTWHLHNQGRFGGRMRAPQIRLVDTGSVLGRWCGQERCLQIATNLIVEHHWSVVSEVLLHEMAHQYVQEVLQISDETAHGPAFRRLCEERGIDGRAVGVPQAQQGERVEQLLQRVARLLALAESSNEHEARNAATAARRLMLRYNLESVASGKASSYCHRHLGEPATRIWEHRRVVAGILSEHFFVECIWVPMWSLKLLRFGQQLEICGTRENLDIAAYVHDFLEHTGAALWVRHRETRGLKGDKGRLEYLAGVMAGFEESLAEGRRKSEGEGLVWLGDAALHEYLEQRHPRTRTVHYGHRELGDAWKHGHAEGRRLVLSRGVSQGARDAAPKSLPPRRP